MKRNNPLIYLASQSPRRGELLEKMGLRYKRVPSTYKERPMKGVSPEKLVILHALGKAEKAKLPVKKGLVLGSDTIVYFNNRILGKPKSIAEAKRMLSTMSGKKHIVMTGVAFIDYKHNEVLASYDETEIKFKRLSERAVDEYVQKVDPLDKAGGYAIQKSPKIVEWYKGSYSNVIGLPRELLKEMLKELKK